MLGIHGDNVFGDYVNKDDINGMVWSSYGWWGCWQRAWCRNNDVSKDNIADESLLLSSTYLLCIYNIVISCVNSSLPILVCVCVSYDDCIITCDYTGGVDVADAPGAW